MRRSIPLVAGVLIAASSVLAQEEPPGSWADPTLEDALANAAVVVRGHVRAPLAGESEPRLDIEKIVAGDAKGGVSVPLHGTKVAASLERVIPPPAPGTEGIFILRAANAGGKAQLELFTPSFGRFTVVSGLVAGFFRNSFVTVTVKADDYETFLRAAWASTHGGRPDTAFIDSCRTTLAALDVQDAGSAAGAHVALEGLRFGAEPKDARLATRFFASPKFQLRVSAARVLERAGGEEAGAALVRLAFNDSDPVVQTTAIEALSRVKPTPANAKHELLARLKLLPADSTLLHTSMEDPRTNEVKGPLYAAFATLRELGAGDDATKTALELLAKDEVEPFMAGVLHLAKVKAKDSVPEIVAKMRGKDSPYGFFNEKLGDLLEELTGEKHGASKEAWQAYLEKK